MISGKVAPPADSAIAHYRESDGKNQSVSEHLLGVARLSRENAQALGLQNMGELLGLLHDIGKWSAAFQKYIGSATGLFDEDADDYVSASGLKGKIDHATAGAQYIVENTAARDKTVVYAGEVLALCLASHHSGLIDALSPDGEDVLSTRLKKADDKTHYREITTRLPPEIEAKIHQLIDDVDTWQAFSNQIKLISEMTPYLSPLHFTVGSLIKFLLSCLIDADRQDTADFNEPERMLLKNDGMYAGWDDLERRLDARLSEFIARNEVDAIRGHISATCYVAGDRDKGIFLLTVPTGGGKTLASLRFALRHAQKHGMKRIIYVIPYTSIIDQNADDVRMILEGAKYGTEQRGRIVLEHHSNLTPEEETSQQKILAENWDAPIVFTTSVQFLEALFGHGTRGIRRLHQLSDAVIIFDEVQTLPIRCVHLFNNTINFLVHNCGSTAVMCTATQPLLEDVDPKRGSLSLPPNAELMPDVQRLFADLKRVDVKYECRDGGWSISEVAQRAIEEQKESGSSLVVVNTKRSAKELYLELKRNTRIEVLHLSTNMCPAHRLRILRHIRWLLTHARPVICVSTQLIEAGIDVDFGSVIRFVAGLDSIAQAAGRCNRNGLRPMGHVIVINPSEENLKWLPDIRIGIDCTERVMREFEEAPEKFDNDRIGPKAMKRYYELYFFKRSDSMVYPVDKKSSVGRDDNLLSLLSDNSVSRLNYQQAHEGNAPKTLLTQSFMSASKAFEAIDSNTSGVIVPYREGKDIITGLLATDNIHRRIELLKKAQRYSINTFGWQRESLIKAKALHEVDGTGILYLDQEYYDKEFGMNEKGDGKLELLNC
jgi:CRISPR-associated endonuclease/helicase Cas3